MNQVLIINWFKFQGAFFNRESSRTSKFIKISCIQVFKKYQTSQFKTLENFILKTGILENILPVKSCIASTRVTFPHIFWGTNLAPHLITPLQPGKLISSLFQWFPPFNLVPHLSLPLIMVLDWISHYAPSDL